MTLSFPSSLRKGLQISVAVAAAALIGLTPSDASAKKPNIKRQSDITVSFALTATAAAPQGASGEAEIRVKESRKGGSEAKLKVDVSGLAAGTYVVDAYATASTEVLFSAPLVVPAAVTTTTGDATVEAEAELEVSLADVATANAISTITVSSETTDTTTDPATVVKTVLLQGEANTSTALLKYFANVPVTAPPASALTTTPTATDDTTTEVESGKGKGVKTPKAKKVHGHALAKLTVSENSTTKRFFLFVGFGAPADATLNIVSNGATIGTVTSTKQGKVKFREDVLAETVDLSTLGLLTITTADGVVVMQADFSSAN